MLFERPELRELLLYKGSISEEEVAKLLKQLTCPGIPLFGFLDLSWFFSFTPKILIKRVGNTLTIYIEMKQSQLELTHLLFPFRIGKKAKIERIKQKLISFSFPLITGENLLELMLKGNFAELEIRVFRILGKYLAFGKAIKPNGTSVGLIILSPKRFLAINLEKHPSVYMELLEPMPKIISTMSRNPIFIGDGFSIGLEHFDPFQHTLVVGESGSGKTTFLLTYIKFLLDTYPDARIVVIDPHGEFIKRYPWEKRVIDFKNEYIEPVESVGEYSPMIAQLITQLLMESIGKENKFAERVVFHAVHLLGSIGKLTLQNIQDLLVDEAKRMEFIVESDLDEAKNFFDREYENIYIHHFNEAVLPVVNFISEYSLYLGKAKKKVNLLKELEENRLVVISFDPNFYGRKMIKFFGAAIINQMYLLALTGKLKHKTMLVIDELKRVETTVIKDILAETRKFNLYLIVATQYLGQFQKSVLDAIIGNVRNIIAFKLHKKDAELLSGMMEIKVEEFFKKMLSVAELEEKKKEMFVRLDQGEAIVRLFDGTKYLLPMKVKVIEDRHILNKN